MCTIILVTLDSLNHTILLDKLYEAGSPSLWSIVKDVYSDLTSNVKWMGELSDSFTIQQNESDRGLYCHSFSTERSMLKGTGPMHWMNILWMPTVRGRCSYSDKV